MDKPQPKPLTQLQATEPERQAPPEPQPTSRTQPRPPGRFVSMFVKLFLALAAASLLAFSGLLYGAMDSSREALIEQKSEDMTMFVERTGQYLDLYLQNIRNILLNASSRMDEAMLSDTDGLQRMLRTQIELNSGIVAHLFVLRRDGTVVSSNQLAYDIVGHPELRRLFRIADENPGLVNWSEPYYSPMQVERTIAFALALKDDAGVVLAEISTSQLTKRLNELLYDSDQDFTLFTGQGHIVSYDPDSRIVPYKPATLPPELDDDFADALIGLPNGISRVAGAAGPLMAVKSERNQLGWYLVTLTDEKLFRQGVRHLYGRFAGVGALWFSLLLVLTLAISRHFATPINRLALQMDRIRGERLVAPFRQIERSDEIGRLSRSFYTMVGRIQELVQTVKENEERKKAMEMKLLLSQIRPHFLYNTLACIGSLAKQHRTEEVEETIRSLIKLLSYSIGRSDLVALEEEIGALRAYAQIQRVRYGETFRYEERLDGLDPSLLAVRVPKLLLQPLVENAFFHGIAGKGGGTVRLQAAEEQGRLRVSVWDDGEGMTEERIAELLRPLSGAEEGAEPGDPARGSNGIGLANVRERLRLGFGPGYDLDIRSEPGRWTLVTIELPLP
ncbi:cache domain-containing sensor histidine kinase [Paenibacillus flagellatus]|uniref:histidine kinase n=1 Tax=Paenibacillus flagellatus TaxID=2211139 RepID=A0A2V5KE47_9BACL|nr:sensor histidine kinase [Paenibacillus flagellatus]PYI56584.1 hypothetical protein DLM86_06345 [Paenibacillus flagellatus]